MVAKREITLLMLLGILGLVVYLVGCSGGKEMVQEEEEDPTDLLQAENRRLLDEAERARKELDTARSGRQKAVQDAQAARAEQADLKKRIDAIEKQLTEANAQSSFDKGRIRDLEKELAMASQKLKAFEKEIIYPTSYRVKRGDCLWYIAGYEFIYNDPFKWPVIYKANKDKIKDPDLIYPMQVFAIPRENV